jgi:MFS family permease
MSTETPKLPSTFSRLAWSNLSAQSAEQIALAAAPIVAVLLLGVGEGQTGLLQTALTLPFVLFAIPAGLLADRMSRRRLMAGAEALRALALGAILALIACGWLTLPLLALLGFICVCGTVVYSVAAPALVPSLVPPQSLPAANARIELARTVAFAGGPALGGVLVGWIGAAPAFGVAAALSAVAVVLLSAFSSPRAISPRGGIHCRRSRKAWPSCCITTCCGRCSSPSLSSTPARSWYLRCSCPMRCATFPCRQPASEPRLRCMASAWWSARSPRRG